MRRIFASVAAFALVVAAPGLASSAFAHGGQYRGPPGEVPPDPREPADPPPPPDPGGPQTPGGENPGGPTTGGPDASGPSTPGGGGGTGAPATGGNSGGPSTGGGGGGAPTTGGGRGPGASKGAGLGSWEFWWGFNKDEILLLKASVIRMSRGPESFGLGRNQSVRGVADAAIRDRIVPALRALLADESQGFHVRSAAELGLAKIGDESIVATLQAMALNEKKTFHRELEETAGLALGVLQRDDMATRRFLEDVVVTQAKDGSYVRPFSAVSLGLLPGKTDRDRSAIEALLAVVAHREPGADVKPSCLEALGLIGDDAVVPELVAMVKNGKASAPGAVALNGVETAYAVAALGKIGRAGTDRPGEETCALDEILRVIEKDKSKTSADARRSAVIALGQIGRKCAPKTQRTVEDALKAIVEGNVEEQERHFALMSLGRIGAAKSVEPATRRDIVSTLCRVMEKTKGQTSSFAAMALGLVGRAICDEGGAAPEEEIRAPLRAKFRQGGDAHSRGAFALASGLVRDPLAAEEMLKTLGDKNADKRVRGWCALGLGLIGSREATESIRTALKTEADKDLRVQAAMAAGLLQDPTVIVDLIDVLKSRDSSNYELGSAALALGQIGDERAIDALLEIAVDKADRWPELTRALAVVALGQIGDRRDVPVLARVSTDINYRAYVPAITELLSIL